MARAMGHRRKLCVNAHTGVRRLRTLEAQLPHCAAIPFHFFKDPP